MKMNNNPNSLFEHCIPTDEPISHLVKINSDGFSRSWVAYRLDFDPNSVQDDFWFSWVENIHIHYNDDQFPRSLWTHRGRVVRYTIGDTHPLLRN